MSITLREGDILNLHLSDVYYEKKPGEMTYLRRYCNQGYVIFRPCYSYILPIFEHPKQQTHEIKKRTEIFMKLSISCTFIDVEEDEIGWAIEYINTGDLWTFGIAKPVAKVQILSVLDE